MNKLRTIALVALGFTIGEHITITRANKRIRSIKARHKTELSNGRLASFERGMEVATNPIIAELERSYNVMYNQSSILDYRKI